MESGYRELRMVERSTKRLQKMVLELRTDYKMTYFIQAAMGVPIIAPEYKHQGSATYLLRSVL